MADSDQILQLGIEEARNGNREAARNLFELLTRQEPDNAQGWLWLAGVADGPDQRREALQQVIALDPENEMARKGLQAMGVTPAPAASLPPTIVSEPIVEPEPEPSRPRSADEAFADELDLAFSEDYASIPRAEAPRRVDEEGVTATGAAIGTGEGEPGARRSTGATARRPRISVRPIGSAADEDEDEEAPRRGPSPLLWALLALIGVVLIGWLLASLFFPPGGGGTATLPTTVPIVEPTAVPGEGQPTAVPGEGQPTAVPGEGQPTAVPGEGQPTAVPTEAQPTAAPPVTPPEQANPAPVPVGTTLEANGWSYSYPNANYAVVLGKQAGGQTAQGSFVHVLAWVSNSTGTDQRLPADFFVLKDGQGRVYTAQPAVSSALVQRGVNADIGMEDNVPANGLTTSVYLVFDVQPGATDLTLFARGNPAQGFKLAVTVP